MMKQVIESDPELRVAGLAGSVAEAEAMLDGALADVMTLDIEMPGISGMAYLEQLNERHDLPVIMLSAHTGRGDHIRTDALLAGAAGCFNKADAVRNKAELIRMIKAAAHHRARMDAEDKAAVKEAQARAEL